MRKRMRVSGTHVQTRTRNMRKTGRWRESAQVRPKPPRPDSIVRSYLQRLLMVSNTSHILFLLTKGSATLSRLTLRQDKKAPQQQRVKGFLSSRPASGKCAFHTAQNNKPGQATNPNALPGKSRSQPHKTAQFLLVALTGNGNERWGEASESCMETEQIYL